MEKHVIFYILKNLQINFFELKFELSSKLIFDKNVKNFNYNSTMII